MNKKNILFLALAALSVSSAVFGMKSRVDTKEREALEFAVRKECLKRLGFSEDDLKEDDLKYDRKKAEFDKKVKEIIEKKTEALVEAKRKLYEKFEKGKNKIKENENLTNEEKRKKINRLEETRRAGLIELYLDFGLMTKKNYKTPDDELKALNEKKCKLDSKIEKYADLKDAIEELKKYENGENLKLLEGFIIAKEVDSRNEAETGSPKESDIPRVVQEEFNRLDVFSDCKRSIERQIKDKGY